VGNEVVTTNILPFWVIGNEGGFFPSLVGPVTQVLMGPAERYDIIFDFWNVPMGKRKRFGTVACPESNR
jgi:FtsP/CotA-like multicopper oxidase with cupredoxin domain